MDNSASKSLSISLSSEAAQVFRESAEKYIKFHNTDLVESGVAKMLDLYIDASSAEKALNAILKDNKIDPVEAPLLYDIASVLAGDDRLLDESEAVRLYTTLTEYINEMMIGTTFDILRRKAAEATVPGASHLAWKKREDKVLKEDINAIFSVDNERRELLMAGLLDAEDNLDDLVFLLQDTIKYLRERESSVFNFMSAENMLGISTYITFDGMTFSSMELNGCREFLRKLYELQAGLKIFRENYENGYLIENNAYVRKFIESPYGILADVKRAFRITPDNGSVICDLCELKRRTFLGIVRMAVDSGALRFAARLAKSYTSQFGADEGLKNVLPSRIFRFLDNEFTAIGNIAASYESIAALAFGGALGFFIGGLANGAAASGRVYRTLKFLSPITPGMPILGAAGKTPFRSFLKLAGNIGMEVFKLNTFAVAGNWIADDKGARLGGVIYLFGAGLTGGYLTASGAYLLKLLSSDSNAALRMLSGTGEVQKSYIEAIVAFAGRAANTEMKSFRLPRAASAGEIEMKLADLERLGLKISTEASRMASRIRAKLEQIERFIAENGKYLDGTKAAERVREISQGGNPGEVFKQLGDLLKGMRETVKKAKLKESPPLTVSPVKKYSPVPAKTGGGKGKGGAKYTEAESAAVQGEGRFSAKAFKALIKEPPDAVSGADILKATGDKVGIRGGSANAVAAFYSKHPPLRPNFWRAIENLLTSKEKWSALNNVPLAARQYIDPSRAVMTARLGKYSILVQPTPSGSYEISAILLLPL